jgi:hypothetical protein
MEQPRNIEEAIQFAAESAIERGVNELRSIFEIEEVPDDILRKVMIESDLNVINAVDRVNEITAEVPSLMSNEIVNFAPVGLPEIDDRHIIYKKYPKALRTKL